MKSILSVFKHKIALLFIAFMFVSAPAFSQANMLFCFSNNDTNGEPDWPFTTISFAKDKTVRCMVYLTQKLDTYDFVSFKTYYQSSDKEPFTAGDVYKLSIQSNWDWFYYKFNFSSIGNYKIVLTDSKDKVIGEKTLHLVE